MNAKIKKFRIRTGFVKSFSANRKTEPLLFYSEHIIRYKYLPFLSFFLFKEN